MVVGDILSKRIERRGTSVKYILYAGKYTMKKNRIAEKKKKKKISNILKKTDKKKDLVMLLKFFFLCTTRAINIVFTCVIMLGFFNY